MPRRGLQNTANYLRAWHAVSDGIADDDAFALLFEERGLAGVNIHIWMPSR